jgi:hypothetical protein
MHTTHTEYIVITDLATMIELCFYIVKVGLGKMQMNEHVLFSIKFYLWTLNF